MITTVRRLAVFDDLQHHCCACANGPEEVDLGEELPLIAGHLWVCRPCWQEIQAERAFATRHQGEHTNQGRYKRAIDSIEEIEVVADELP